METTKVTLVHKGKEQEFDIDHAERILKLQAEKSLSDWELPETSGFKFKDGTIQPTGTGATQKSGKQGKS